MKIIFVADAHLKGIDDPVQERLAGFLNGLAGLDTLVILGDLFDIWCGFNKVVYYQYLPVLNSLKRLKASGTKIIYIEGNHDFAMQGFFESELGAGVHAESLEMEADGRHMYLAHGDTVGMSTGYSLWRRFLRSRAFGLLTGVLSAGLVWRIASMLSRRSRTRLKPSSIIEARQKEFARRKVASGIDAVVMGHSHIAGVHDIHGGGVRGIYANPGAWIDGSYLVCSNGEFRVERYDSRP
jgi:UDP-2,3-diacylglucosamine hydrolase